MTIAGVGRKGAPDANEAEASGPSSAGSERFELPSEEEVLSERASSQPRSELQVLELEAYLTSRVEMAVAHLQDTLTDEQLALLKEALFEQLKNDPVLLELARRATGQSSLVGKSRG